jgi:hypothetical protein
MREDNEIHYLTERKRCLMTEKQWTRETLGEDVGDVLVGRQPLQFECTFFDMPAYEVITKVDVFGVYVIGCLLGECNGASIVCEELERKIEGDEEALEERYV